MSKRGTYVPVKDFLASFEGQGEMDVFRGVKARPTVIYRTFTVETEITFDFDEEREPEHRLEFVENVLDPVPEDITL